MEPLILTYKQRQETFGKLAGQWQQKFNVFSWLRVLTFIGIVGSSVLLIYLNVDLGLILLLVVAGLLLFSWLVKKHQTITRQRNQYRFLVQINEEEQDRLAGKFYPTDTGSDFSDPLHPYTGDLDIFGRSSLFVLLNRTNSSGGRQLLAHWMKEAASIGEIEARQEAVAELRGDIDWRQQFQASGRHVHDDPAAIGHLLTWLNEPPQIGNRQWLVALTYLLPLFTIGSILLALFTESVTYHLPVLLMLINAALLRYTFREVHQASEATYQSVQTLKTYEKLLYTLETQSFASVMLKQIRSQLGKGTGVARASQQIRKLASLLDNLQARRNVYFYLLVNTTLLWDLFWMIRLERWKRGISPVARQWFTALAQAEALNSLAGFAYANPQYPMPTVSEADIQFSATALGHPLILREKRVKNDFTLSKRGTTGVITGSNMSGKSTFLRTVGINGVLALMGAPVCANSLSVSRFQIFTAMRTQDSLEESVSSFYAELKRLRQLVELLPADQPIFYLLDEILKGTNSHDRHEGAKALIRQLHRYNAAGLVSTHDLALGELADEMPGSVLNYSFNSDFKDGKLYFDYQLKAGICRSFNASHLMRQMGIEV